LFVSFLVLFCFGSCFVLFCFGSCFDFCFGSCFVHSWLGPFLPSPPFFPHFLDMLVVGSRQYPPTHPPSFSSFRDLRPSASFATSSLAPTPARLCLFSNFVCWLDALSPFPSGTPTNADENRVRGSVSLVSAFCTWRVLVCGDFENNPACAPVAVHIGYTDIGRGSYCRNLQRHLSQLRLGPARGHVIAFTAPIVHHAFLTSRSVFLPFRFSTVPFFFRFSLWCRLTDGLLAPANLSTTTTIRYDTIRYDTKAEMGRLFHDEPSTLQDKPAPTATAGPVDDVEEESTGDTRSHSASSISSGVEDGELG
jgi:hypothetical protein